MQQTTLNRSRNDKFIMVVDLPTALKDQYSPIEGDFFEVAPLQLSIYGSPVPEISVPAVSVPYGGQVYRTSSFSRPEYSPLSVKFLVDNGYKNYWTLWNWLNLLNDAKESVSSAHASAVGDHGEEVRLTNSFRKYISRFTIFGLDEYNHRVISFTYTDAFPTTLSEINFSNQEPSEIQSTITFVFNQLHVELVKDVNKSDC